MRRGLGILISTMALLAVPAMAAAAPANDDFEDRQVLSGTLPIAETGTNLEATCTPPIFTPTAGASPPLL